MKNNTKKLLSFALAGTVVAGANATVAHAADMPCNNPTVTYETTCEDLCYVVQEGDTLSDISLMFYGNPCYYEALAKYNNIEDSWWIYEGQVIKIPRKINDLITNTHPREFAPDQVYYVEQGDIMFNIVENYYGEDNRNLYFVDRLATYNNLEDPNLIYEGQELFIPEEAKLRLVVPNDYSLQYKMLDWRVNHPGEPYPFPVPEKGCTRVLKPNK